MEKLNTKITFEILIAFMNAAYLFLIFGSFVQFVSVCVFGFHLENRASVCVYLYQSCGYKSLFTQSHYGNKAGFHEVNHYILGLRPGG